MAYITSIKSWKEGRQEKGVPEDGAVGADKRLEARAKATEEALYVWREARAKPKKKPWWKFW
ncbi:MAG: hypothetical protein M1609_01255 [Firmicutes bacterium]|nr:hypothetical protein [Bacillota bacterium]